MNQRKSFPNATSTPNGINVHLPKKKSPELNNSSRDISGVYNMDDSGVPAVVQRTKSKRSVQKKKEKRHLLKMKIRERKSKEKAVVRECLIEAKQKLKEIEISKPAINTFKSVKIALSEIRKCKRAKQKKSCQDELLSLLSSNIPEFQDDLLSDMNGFTPLKGAFGEVTVCKINYLNVNCARKTVKGTMGDLRAEALVMQSLSGHSSFPYLYGLTKSGAILMEYVSSQKNFLSASRTLHSALRSSDLSSKNWFDISRDLVKALTFMHDKGILHNDIHGSNILIRHTKRPCFVDFGKATLIKAPIIYDIVPGSKEQKLYNSLHLHLAYELRNIQNSPQTVYTDIYSLGYNFLSIGKHQSIKEIRSIGSKMTLKDPLNRCSLVDCSVGLLKFV